MHVDEPQKPGVRVWTLWVLTGIFAVGILALGWRLWQVQVLEPGRYGSVQARQSLRLVEHPGLRGRIFDRNGVVLADNRPAYAVVIYCEELRQPGAWNNTILAIDALIDQLARRLGLPRQISREKVVRHIRESRPVPLIVWQDVQFPTLAYISEQIENLPGVEILPMPQRFYPQGSLAAHLLGYVGQSDATKQETVNWNYRLPDVHGRGGIEQFYDALLSGKSGEEALLVDSRVYTRERWIRSEAQTGGDLTLTLDSVLQRTAEKALAGRAGAVVALNPNNGDILALASAPAYDLNTFVPTISSKAWNLLLKDKRTPLFNRAIQGQYAPGSVFKPLVAVAAQEQAFNADTLYACTGAYTDYHCHLRCANRYGHGELDMRQALMKSCNPYFCNMGVKIGIDAIVAVAQQAGFGTKTGIDLPGERPGFIPTPEWKRRQTKVPWLPSDTAQCAIGQGAVLTTPLQIAHAIGAIAAGGKVYRPRVVAFGAGGELQRRLPWSGETVQAVVDGMEMAVLNGTGKTMQVEGVRTAGKTGTAEYMDGGVRRKHVWSVAFAPIEKPEIVVCAMLDNGIGGGRDAGPIVQAVLATYFKTTAPELELDDETLED